MSLVVKSSDSPPNKEMAISMSLESLRKANSGRMASMVSPAPTVAWWMVVKDAWLFNVVVISKPCTGSTPKLVTMAIGVMEA